MAAFYSKIKFFFCIGSQKNTRLVFPPTQIVKRWLIVFVNWPIESDA